MKTTFILILSLLLLVSHVHSEEITANMAIGCPTIEAYDKYLKFALSGNNSATLQAAADLNCRILQKGDKVKVIKWNMRKNLVNVLPEGNSMTFWLPGEVVSTGETKEPPRAVEFPKIHGDTILELEPFVVKLPDSKGTRYLKVQLAIEFESRIVLDKAIIVTPKLKDISIMMISSLNPNDAINQNTKYLLKNELMDRFNRVFAPDHVNNIFFTEFIMQ